MPEIVVIYADFNNADSQRRLRLNCQGTMDDLQRTGLRLEEGLRLKFSDGYLEAEGEVVFSREEEIWVAIINWNDVKEV